MKEEFVEYDNKIILQNMAQCLKCKDVLVSPVDEHAGRVVQCSCGNLRIYGGKEFLHREFKGEWRELSVTMPISSTKQIKNVDPNFYLDVNELYQIKAGDE